MEINLVSTYRALLQDLCIKGADCNYLLKRLRNEGFAFVSQVLPSFSKHILLCYERGYWSAFNTSIRTRGGLPVLFRGYLKQLFHFDGVRYVSSESPDPVALYVIRQACEYFYKLAVPVDSSPEMVDKFTRTDQEVLSSDYDKKFVDSMRKNFETFYRSSSAISLEDIARRAYSGPGTFTGSDRTYYRKNHLPATVQPQHSYLSFGLRLNRRSPLPDTAPDYNYSEVLFVPKDSRGPRVIVREPYSNLQFQMGFNACLSSALEKDTKHRINFVSQEINKSLAHSASITGHYCTLDLKDASDRVSNVIVRHIFRYTRLVKAVELFRTPFCKLPNGSIVKLNKLAGMGSGFTFPTMALVIHLAICTHVSQVRKIPYRTCMNQVYVYGDDIIMPTHWYELGIAALTKVGLSVNTEKSFRNSKFRESCGGDYLYGNDVTPTRLKLLSSSPCVDGRFIRPSPCGTKDDFFILGIERHCRQLVQAQLYTLAEYYYSKLEYELGPLPFVGNGAAALGRCVDNPHDYLPRPGSTGLYPRVRVLVPKPVRDRNLEGKCPYRYLRNIWRQESPVSDEFGSPVRFQDIIIPRRIKIRPAKVNSYSLTAKAV